MARRARKPKNKAELHEWIVSEFYDIESQQRSERKQSLEDRRFYSISGAQWEGRLGDLYENKPQLEVNKTHLSVIRIINEYRNNRITVDFISKDGSDRDDLADVCDGLYRADEQDSVADEAYDNCFEEGVGGGMGAIRYRTIEEDEDDDENLYLRTSIEPIFDADTCVYFDLDAKRQDKSDAKRCWVLIPMTKHSFREEFRKEPVSFQKDTEETQFDWQRDDTVYIAEHYRMERKREKVQTWKMLDGEEREITEEDYEENEFLEDELLAIGGKMVGERTVKRRRVRKYLVDGQEILEDCGYIDGPNIPIAPFYGKRWVVSNIERMMGHVRLQKDSQRLGNIQRSELATIASMSPYEKPIFTSEQMEGNEQRWKEDNVKNYPYQLINGIEDSEGNIIPSGPVGYVKAPAVPAALAALINISDQDQRDLQGNPEQGEQIRSNISEESYSLIQTQLGMQTYIYMSNFAKTIQRGGEIWLGQLKDIATDKGRRMKTVGPKKEVGQIELKRPIIVNGDTVLENDFRDAKFDIVADVGPSSSSKKSSTVKSIVSMLPFVDDAQDKTVLTSTAIMNMEGEGLNDTQEYFRKKLVAMNVEKGTEEEEAQKEQAAANQQPSPNDQFMLSEKEKNMAQATKLRAETVETIADTEKKKAETVEIYAGIGRDDRDSAVKTAQAIGNAVSAPPQRTGEQ